jgi:DNA-binding protein H-NS
MPTLEQIQAKMKKLQVQADALIATKAQAAVDQIRKIMLAHGLTTEDIEAKAKAKREAKMTNGIASRVKAKVASSLKGSTPPKYQHPKTGATWTGHGRAPAWITDTKDRKRYLIANGADAALTASAGANAGGKVRNTVSKTSSAADVVAHKGQRKGPQPAKYLDPKTGAKWSGRGPAPAWLGAEKDRSKFLIVDAAAAPATGTKTASKAKSSATSSAIAKKALVRKATSTKVTPKKGL